MARQRTAPKGAGKKAEASAWDVFARSVPRFTAAGYFVLLLLLSLAITAEISQNNFVFMALSLLAGLFLFSFWYPFLSLRRLVLTRERPKEIFAGQEVHFGLTLRNENPFFSAYAVAVSDLPEVSSIARFGFAFIFHIPPRGQGSSSYPIKFRRRGLYKGSSYLLESSFPFGFFTRRVHGTAATEFLVYPRIRPVRFETRGSFLPGVDQLSQDTFHGLDEFKLLREYRPGDHPRFIHWKATARHQKLMVRDNERYEKRKVTLVLDTRPLRRAQARRTEAVFERAVSLAASLAVALVREGSMVRLCAFAPERIVTRFGLGAEHLKEILRILALAKTEPNRTLNDILRKIPGAEGSTLVVVAQKHARAVAEAGRLEAGGDMWVIDASARHPVCRRAGAPARGGAAPLKFSQRTHGLQGPLGPEEVLKR
jgi:uncharacterized protein (DUF58 family)